MYFAKFFYKIRIFDSYSLKDKRKTRTSLIKKIQSTYKISVAEVGDQDIHNSLALACSMVGSKRAILEEVFYGIIKLVEQTYDVEVYESDYQEY